MSKEERNLQERVGGRERKIQREREGEKFRERERVGERIQEKRSAFVALLLHPREK